MSKPQPPSALKVKHLVYTVTWTDQPILCDTQHCHGLCDTTAERITVSTAIPKRQIAETFLHESIHAMNEEEGVNDSSLKTMTEEDFTGKVAKMICTLTADNNDGMKWFVEQFA